MMELNLQAEQEELPYVLSALTEEGLTITAQTAQADNDAIFNHLVG